MTTSPTYAASVRRYEYRDTGVAAMWIGAGILVVIGIMWAINVYKVEAAQASEQAEQFLAEDQMRILPTGEPLIPVVTSTPNENQPIFNAGNTEICTPELKSALDLDLARNTPFPIRDDNGRLWRLVDYDEKCEQILTPYQ